MGGKSILIVEDEPGMRRILSDLAVGLGCQVTAVEDGEAAVAQVDAGHDVMLLDLSLPKLGGIEVLRRFRASCPETRVIVLTAYASMETAIEAMRLGAYDYITKPFEITRVEETIVGALRGMGLLADNQYFREELKRRYNFENIIGANVNVQRAYLMAAKVARTDASVLILGETGTGKEYLAKTIHYQSPRYEGPFVAVHCGALPETLLESELFGHEKGAFTNAFTRHIGRFERACKGTLFLDEVGDISLSTQVKLLRVLQEREFERLGGTETIRADVRVIAATHHDLQKAIRDGTFREDLYYRLNVVTIWLPPLRERPEDIPLFANHFLQRFNKAQGTKVSSISPEAMEVLLKYPWPGNLRELQNCIERAVILADGNVITPDLLNLDEPARPVQEPGRWPLIPLRDAEKQHIAHVLRETGFNQSKAARILGIDRKTLRAKIREFNLGPGIADGNGMEP
ncbi:MAG: sigma-54-dependent transcriptional regulator [Armatimonadota bacterium]